MKDIYSPLEIDEEWDNFAPVDTAVAPAPEAPVTQVAVSPQTESPVSTLPTAEPMSTNSESTLDMSIGTDPARDEANKEIGQEDATKPAVEDNIAKWTANDGNTATEHTDKLEFNEMGSQLPADKAADVPVDTSNLVKVNVNPAPNAEAEKPMSDEPSPVVISSDVADLEPTAEPESKATNSSIADSTPAEPTVAEEPSEQEDSPVAPESKDIYVGNTIEDVKKDLLEKIEALKKEREKILASKEAMMEDKKKKTDDFNQAIAAIDDGIKSADSKIADHDKFIAQLESFK